MLLLTIGLALITLGALRQHRLQTMSSRDALKPLSARQANTWERRAANTIRARR